MQGLLDKEGYEVDSNINDANFVLVNTCSFLETAREESIRQILEYTNKGKEVIVAGCMAQHFKDELLKETPEIKRFGWNRILSNDSQCFRQSRKRGNR